MYFFTDVSQIPRTVLGIVLGHSEMLAGWLGGQMSPSPSSVASWLWKPQFSRRSNGMVELTGRTGTSGCW